MNEQPITIPLTLDPQSRANLNSFINDNNTGSLVTSVSGGTGITASPATGDVVVTNTGVTSLTAGTGISVSASTGGVTITNTATSGLAWKFSTGSRSNTAASGSQTIAHGLGKTPSYLKISFFGAFGSSSIVNGVGVYDGTNMNMAYTNTIPGSGTTGNAGGGVMIDTRDNGVNGQSATVTLDATNINLTWTKAAAPLSGNIYMLCEVWG